MEVIENTLNGKTVVITGASSGVGRAAAEVFALEGCSLVLAARGKKGIDEIVAICRALGAIAIGVYSDVSKAEDVNRIADEALKLTGRIDVWVNNAGVMASGKFEEIPMEIHEQVIKTNLFGYLHGAYEAITIFKRQNEGILINNVSIGGYVPAPYSAVYSATKYGIRGMMECLQGEVSNRSNIHICNLYPQLQNSTGNLHSAKYSGFNIPISPIASDPFTTAAKMVELAKNPKKHKYPDLKAALITNLYLLFPRLIINAASAVIRYKMENNEDKKGNPGNILEQSADPHRVYGNPAQTSTDRKLGLAVLAGIGIGLGLVMMNAKED